MVNIKIIAATLVILTIGIFAVGFIHEQQNLKKPLKIGVSYSPRYAQELGLDAKKTYSEMLTDLGVKHLRLNAYWDEIEPEKGQFQFEEIDHYINEAAKNNASVILSIGMKLPRWPECFTPAWVDRKDLAGMRQNELEMLKIVVDRYEKNPTITAWQVENEPMFGYGVCPPISREHLQAAVNQVRAQSSKPIIVTDSGELRPWRTPMQLSDIFGTTLYRTVSNPIFGRFIWRLPAWSYSLKSHLVRALFAPENKETIISELQAESWFDKPMTEIPVDEQIKVLTPNDLKENVKYSHKTGFSSTYLWGVEWWYYLASKGHGEYLETAKEIF